MRKRKDTFSYNLMLLPGMVMLLVYYIAPMFGFVIAFQNFNPAAGVFKSRWVGLDNLLYMFQIPDTRQIIINTIIISLGKIILMVIVSVTFAILLNEVRQKLFRKTIQTIVFIPYFLSWVVLASAFKTMFDLDGIVNEVLNYLNFEKIMFLGSNVWFRPILIVSDVWKGFGFWTVVYLAAIAGISPTLYEVASIDGASRFKRILHITLPGITTSIIIMLTLNIGYVLHAGYEQVINLYNPLVYRTGDIIDTYVYRIGLIQMQYGLATAIGFFKSGISFLIVFSSHKIAEKYANYRIF